MNGPNQPSRSRDPRPPREEQDPAKEAAKGAALGCVAGLGAIGTVLMAMAVAGTAMVAIGIFLLYLTCGGH